MLSRIRFALPLLALLSSSIAGAAVFTVGSDGSCTHATLAAALAAASANGTGHDEIRLRIDAQQNNAAYSITATDVTIAGGYPTCSSASPVAGVRSTLVGNQLNSVITIGNSRRVELRQLIVTDGGNLGFVQGGRSSGAASISPAALSSCMAFGLRPTTRGMAVVWRWPVPVRSWWCTAVSPEA